MKAERNNVHYGTEYDCLEEAQAFAHSCDLRQNEGTTTGAADAVTMIKLTGAASDMDGCARQAEPPSVALEIGLGACQMLAGRDCFRLTI